MRLWFFRDESNMRLLENDCITLEDAGFRDEDSLLVIHFNCFGFVTTFNYDAIHLQIKFLLISTYPKKI